jgi:hypothetical protein
MLHVLVASLGPAILEAGFYSIGHPHTVTGAYIKEMVLSGSIALALGGLVYFNWKSPASQWVWVLGVIGFVWRVAQGTQAATFYAEAQQATLEFVSVRFLAYSAGALICSAFVKSSPAVAEHEDAASPPH